MNTRPNGLHTKGQPATLREEQATIATAREWDEATAEHARGHIEWSAPASDAQLEQYRREIDEGNAGAP